MFELMLDVALDTELVGEVRASVLAPSEGVFAALCSPGGVGSPAGITSFFILLHVLLGKHSLECFPAAIVLIPAPPRLGAWPSALGGGHSRQPGLPFVYSTSHTTTISSPYLYLPYSNANWELVRFGKSDCVASSVVLQKTFTSRSFLSSLTIS